jgi:hypothetical protein
MKAEHRKELRTNVLYERLTHLWQDLKAGPNTSTIVFCLVILVAAGLVVGWRLWRNHTMATTSASWVKDYNATKLDELQDVAKDYSGTTAAMAAQFEEARTQLRQGLEKLAAADEKERTDAADKVEAAGKLYEQLAKDTDARTYPFLVQEALMGAAKARESLGRLDDALGFYKKLADSKLETDLTRKAQASARDLEDPATKEKIRTFYDELNKQLTAHK